MRFGKASKSVNAGDPQALLGIDALYLERACELANRALGGTSPNPPVGALVVKNGGTIGEGFHRGSGSPHAEVEALRAARDAQGATLYSSLEPCNHTGRTPPCSQAILDAKISRVVIGALDPNPRNDGSGVSALQKAGLSVDVFPSVRAQTMIEAFSVAIRSDRPYVALKLAVSMDGYVAPQRGSFWLTGERARAFVRELRMMHDAVMVGAGTVRIDDPELTVRPPHHRFTRYRRIVVCESEPVNPHSRIFAPAPAYAKTMVVAPVTSMQQFSALGDVADIVPVPDGGVRRLDPAAALRELKTQGVASVLCEGGPTLAGRLIGAGLVDRVYWLVAPIFLANPRALPALANINAAHAGRSLSFDRVEQLGDDVLLSGRLAHV